MKDSIKIVIGAVAGLVVGGGVGYVVADRLAARKYEEASKQEIAEFKANWKRLNKDGIEPQDLVVARETGRDVIDVAEIRRRMEQNQANAMLAEHGQTPISELTDFLRPEEVDGDEVVVSDVENINEPGKIVPLRAEGPVDHNDPLYLEMKAARTANTPYIITVDEYMDGMDENYDQVSLTYFEGDDILMDSSEKPIPEVELNIGPDALTKFGLFSGDENIVHVRNERIKCDFEIARDERTFTEAIAGFKSHKTQRKMREDD